jgi:hypothetical protein
MLFLSGSGAFRHARAQSDTLPHTVFVHGGAGSSGQWGSAINWLLSNYTLPDWDAPDIGSSVPSTSWYQYITSEMAVNGTSALAGYSLGGVASRDALHYANAAGLLTVSSPNTGAPIAGAMSSADNLLDQIIFETAFVFGVQTAEYLEARSALGESLYWEVLSAVDNGVFVMIDWLFGMLIQEVTEGMPPYYEVDLQPGATFITNLPTNISNSFAMAVTMSSGHLGGPLALDQDWTQPQATAAGQWLYNVGAQVVTDATSSIIFIDWEHEHAEVVFAADLAAIAVGNHMMNFPWYWAAAVTEGDVFGTGSFGSDLFIPSSRQTFVRAQLEQLSNGLPHTKVLTDSRVYEWAGESLCIISPKC